MMHTNNDADDEIRLLTNEAMKRTLLMKRTLNSGLGLAMFPKTG
jgi:hypothetical protein